MTREEIEEFITQFPIYQYAFTEPSELEFNERVRAICKKECPRYGNSWSCPPPVKAQPYITFQKTQKLSHPPPPVRIKIFSVFFR